MRINLCKVDNISRENTPRFSTVQQQRDYFDHKIVSYVDTSFYPPHYTNEIKISSDEYTLSDGANYIFFSYKNKIYYYFIDTVEYLNEDVMIIYITMDSVQTYMFNISITGELERESISRYLLNGHINRQYIRENVSEGDFRLHDTKYLTGQAWSNVTKNDNIHGWIVVKCSDRLKASHGALYGKVLPFEYQVPEYPSGNRRVNTAYIFFFFPVIKSTSYSFRITGILSHYNIADTVGGELSATLYELCKESVVVAMYFVPGRVFKDGLYTVQGDTLVMTTEGNAVFRIDSRFGITASDQGVFAYPVGSMEYATDVLSLDKTSSDWNPLIEPAMLDENYTRISFGEQSTDCTYPLYQCTLDSVKCEYWANLIDGFRFYQVLGDTEYADAPQWDDKFPFGIFPDPYRVTVAATTKLSYDLKTDPWIQWNEYNKSSIAMGFVGLAVSAISRGMVGSARISENNTDLREIYNNPDSYDNRFKSISNVYDRPMKAGAHRAVRSLERDNGRVRAQQYSNTAASSGSLLSTATSYYNAWLAPKSPREYGSVGSDILDNAYNQVVSIYKVNDYDRCAFYYHVNGYLVAKYFEGNNFDSLVHRGYFNVVKFRSINLAITGAANDTATVEELKSRLLTGIRLWEYDAITHDTKCSIGDYSHANW